MGTKDEYASVIISEGLKRLVTRRGIVQALACALVETNLVNYANAKVPASQTVPYDKIGNDGRSCGLFQQQPQWWGDGTGIDLMNPAIAAGLFYDALLKLDYNSPSHSPGWYVQQVQRSAYPDRYDLRMSDANDIYERLIGGFHAAAGKVPVDKPAFTEIDRMTGGGRSNRSRPPINFLLHTEEGNSSAENLAAYCDGSHDVSYHYTLRDGILVDVVDTDFASWSVLDANAYTINLCFAGSRSAWSRDEWLARERDIEIAAYIAVQDCRKYSIPTEVIKPPYRRANGISDHRYVTDCLGIGNHTDVGPGFPWDVFEKYVLKWSGAPVPEEDDMSWLTEKIDNFKGTSMSWKDIFWWMDKNTSTTLEKVTKIEADIAELKKALIK